MRHRLVWALAIVVLLGAPIAQANTPWRASPAPAWAERLEPETSAAHAPSRSGASVPGREMLLVQRDVRIEGASVLTYTHTAVRLANESALQGASLLSWEVDPSFEQLLLHSVAIRRDGMRLERLRAQSVRVSAGQGRLASSLFEGTQTVAVVLDDLRVGDVVEYETTFRSTDPTLGGRVSAAVVLGSMEPLHRLRVRVSFPASRQIRWRVHLPNASNGALDPEVQDVGAGRLLSWDLRDLLGVTPEADAPRWYSPLPFVQLTEFGTWGEVAAWGAPTYARASSASPEIRALAASWRKAAISEQQIVERATKLVQEQVRYLGLELGTGRRSPSRAGDVLKRRYGDCKDKSVLLVSLLREAGVAADPALVSTSHGLVLPGLLPSPTIFDHVIVRVKATGSAPLWIDPTATQEGGGLERYASSPYAFAIVLHDGESALERMPEPPPESSSMSLVETFRVPIPSDADVAELDAEREYVGDLADSFRHRLQTESADELDRYFLDLYRVSFPRVEARAPREHADDRARNRLRVVGRYRIPGFWAWDIPESRYKVDLQSTLMGEVLKHPGELRRNSPLAFAHPLLTSHRMMVELPDDWTVNEDVGSEASMAFAFRHSRKYASRRMEVAWELRSKRSFVLAAELAEHSAAVERARLHLTTSVTHRPNPPDGINWAALFGLALLLPAMAYGAVRAWRWSPPAREVADEPGLHKPSLGLVLVGIRCVLVPFTTLRGLMAAWAGSSRQPAGMRHWSRCAPCVGGSSRWSRSSRPCSSAFGATPCSSPSSSSARKGPSRRTSPRSTSSRSFGWCSTTC
jgi:transglutaminase-like putative cysteine protease